MSSPAPALSIVVPCYDEAACLPELHRRLTAAARTAGGSYEIVLVNDGSKDASWRVMRALADADPHLLAINLSRNHGHQLALTAGLDLCRGERILIIDADLQDPPELLPDMLGVMTAQEADVVYAVRRKREGETFFKKATAALFYRALSRVTDTPIPLDAGDFRLMSRRALDALLALPEQARFIRGMVAWIGFRQVPLVYDRAERFSGASGYPLGKMIRFALDAVTGFSTKPLQFASHVGLWLVAASLLLLIYIAVGFLTGTAVQGWTSTMLVVVVLGAVQMFVLGMIGEYLGRLYIEAKRRPLYIVADVVGGATGQATLGHVPHQLLPGAVRGTASEAGDGGHSPPSETSVASPLDHPAAPDGPPPRAGDDLFGGDRDQ